MSILTTWDIAYMERTILHEFGDSVSVMDKLKTVTKFGVNSAIGFSDFETIWVQGGDETYATDNTIDSISSNNAGDTTTIVIECHDVSGSGVEAKYRFIVQEVQLQGQTRVALPQSCARVSRAHVKDGSAAIVGNGYIYENSAITGGVPDDLTKLHAQIDPVRQQNEKAATTFSNEDYFIFTQVGGGVSPKTSATALIDVQIRAPGGAFRTRFTFPVTQGVSFVPFVPPLLIVPKNYDVRLRAIASSNNTEVVGWFHGYIAKVRDVAL